MEWNHQALRKNDFFFVFIFVRVRLKKKNCFWIVIGHTYRTVLELSTQQKKEVVQLALYFVEHCKPNERSTKWIKVKIKTILIKKKNE